MTPAVAIRRQGEVTILDVSGRVTLGDASDALREALAGGGDRILVNLGGVTYIDSSGIGQLMGGLKRITTEQGRLCLINVPKRVQELLKLTGCWSLFNVQPDEQAALLILQ